MTWTEVCADQFLNSLPWRIETDRWGNIVMSPPPRSRHAEYQTEIACLLRQFIPGGLSIAECPLETTEGVKAMDVAWVSQERRKSKANDPAYLIAPEICVEVKSPSNSLAELHERKALYFQKGALEVWFCDEEGAMTFFDHTGPIPRSKFCPVFPEKIVLD
jgi:Uma2 family endonuclease